VRPSLEEELPVSNPAHDTRVGFIGLGIMGHPMSGHLAAAGFELTVFDVDPVAIDRVTALHPAVKVATDPAQVGAQSDIVMTMLPDGQHVQQVAIGPGGLIETMQPGSLLLDTSSAQPWLTLETAAALAGRGVDMIDAPVSGAQWGAEQCNLVFMVGGDLEHVRRVRPILDLLGRAAHHCGPLGSGHIMKCINNTITAMTFLATSEGLALGARAGLDPAAMNDVLNDSTGGSWITANHIGQRILSRTFDDPFRLELMLKDVTIACELARKLGVDLPYAAQCEATYRDANDFAGPGKSLSELARWIEHTTGVDIVPGSTARL
jgi:3-hydroxyisobutyrate dehydrogenase-like beta-hydroxyacid dehydrogenase